MIRSPGRSYIVAPILRADGIWHKRSRYGSFYDSAGQVRDLSPVQQRVPLTDGHAGPRVGELVALVRAADRSYWALGVLDRDEDELPCDWHEISAGLGVTSSVPGSPISDGGMLRELALVENSASMAGPCKLTHQASHVEPGRPTGWPEGYWLTLRQGHEYHRRNRAADLLVLDHHAEHLAEQEREIEREYESDLHRSMTSAVTGRHRHFTVNSGRILSVNGVTYGR